MRNVLTNIGSVEVARAGFLFLLRIVLFWQTNRCTEFSYSYKGIVLSDWIFSNDLIGLFQN